LNIYIGNLPFTASENDLKEIFTEYGEVSSSKIIMDRETGRSRGFGFVEMGDNSARKAIEELNGAEFDGKQLTVNESKPKPRGFGANNRSGGGGNGGGNDRYNTRRSY
jgi:RNA recognition motif-containing protein